MAQLIFEKIEAPIFVECNDLPASERGCIGFDSSDVQGF